MRCESRLFINSDHLGILQFLQRSLGLQAILILDTCGGGWAWADWLAKNCWIFLDEEGFFFRVLDVCYVTYVMYVSKLCTWNDWRHKYAFQYLKLNFSRYSMIIPPIVLFGVKCLSSNPKKKWLNCPSLSRTVWHDHCIINSLVVSSAFRILEGFLRVQMKLLSGFFKDSWFCGRFPKVGIVPSTTDTSV